MIALENDSINKFSIKRRSINQMENIKLRKIRKILLNIAQTDISCPKSLKVKVVNEKEQNYCRIAPLIIPVFKTYAEDFNESNNQLKEETEKIDIISNNIKQIDSSDLAEQ